MDHSTSTPSDRAIPFLINRSFALLSFGQAISFVGDSVFTTTVILWIATRLARGEPWAPAAVGALVLLEALPEILVGPPAGVFVDRWSKKPTLLAMDAARAALLGLLILISGLGTASFFPGFRLSRLVLLGCIYATILLATVCSQFFGPARLALIGDIVPDEQRPRASGIAQMSGAVSGIIGTALAAPLFFGLGAGWALGLDALSFLVSFCAILLVPAPLAAQGVKSEEAGAFIREFRDGLRIVRTNPVLRTVLVTGMFFMLGGGALTALNVFFLQQNLHATPALFGLLGAGQGAGLFIGAFVAGAIADRVGISRLFWMAALLFGLAVLVYSRLTSFAPALALTLIMGMLFAALEVAESPLILRATPHDYVGRVAAIVIPAFSVAAIISTVVAGALASTVLRRFRASVLGMTLGPIDTIFAAAGLLVVMAGLYALLNLRGGAIRPAQGGAVSSAVHDPPPRSLHRSR